MYCSEWVGWALTACGRLSLLDMGLVLTRGKSNKTDRRRSTHDSARPRREHWARLLCFLPKGKLSGQRQPKHYEERRAAGNEAQLGSIPGRTILRLERQQRRKQQEQRDCG